jgi:hypothetical protein
LPAGELGLLPSSTRSIPRNAKRASIDTDKRWVTVAFTWNGLRALDLPETSLTTFPEELQQGMAARAQILGDNGADYPDKLGWQTSQWSHYLQFPSPTCPTMR